MPTNSDSGYEPLKDHHEEAEGQDPLRGVPRLLAFVVVLSALVFVGVLARFNIVASASLAVDLWIVADAQVRPGELVLVDAFSRHPKTGKLVYLEDLWLEAWAGEELVERARVQGELRTAVRMPAQGPLRLRMEVPDPHVGMVGAEQVIEPQRARASILPPPIGGAIPVAGESGFHAVRNSGVCGHRMQVVAYGGVPIASMPNETLVRVTDASGQGVSHSRVRLSSDGVGVTPLVQTTDEDGLAAFTVTLDALSYLEFHSSCADGEQLHGFEVQPSFDGLQIPRLLVHVHGVDVQVVNGSLSQNAYYDLRCDGDVLAYGLVGNREVIQVPSEVFSGRSSSESCQFQLYRQSYSLGSPRAIRPFLRTGGSLGWDWRANADGVTFDRPSRRTQASDTAGAALSAWKDREYGRVNGFFGASFFSVMALWGVMTVRVVRRRRADASRYDGELEEELLEYQPSDRRVMLVLFGWVALSLMFGGLWLLLRLMGSP